MAVSSVRASPLEQVLRHNPIPALRILALEETDAEVVLSGSVSSYYLKQLAQEAVLPLIGQRHLLNQIIVERKR
jgi:hypothetical protein